MTATGDVAFTPVRALGDRLRQGALSPVALTEHCLGRIEAMNATLHAFIKPRFGRWTTRSDGAVAGVAGRPM